jgi:hypothetical protein
MNGQLQSQREYKQQEYVSTGQNQRTTVETTTIGTKKNGSVWALNSET